MPHRRSRRAHGLRTSALLGGLLGAIAVAVAVLLAASPDESEEVRPAASTHVERGTSDGRAPDPRGAERSPEPSPDAIEWRRSKAIGSHASGRLVRGVALPAEGREWASWDPILKRRPNREWRRWGTDRLVRTTLRVLREFGRVHPSAPRVAVGDLSRPEGGDFGPQFGSIGHASHQNGLDVDVYYPRLDERVRPPKRPGQVNLKLAQDLVDRFVAAGAEKVFVGPSLGLTGPSDVVVPLVHHDNHLHARLPL